MLFAHILTPCIPAFSFLTTFKYLIMIALPAVSYVPSTYPSTTSILTYFFFCNLGNQTAKPHITPHEEM